MEKIEVTVPFLYVTKRLDAFLAEALGGSHSRAQVKAALDAGLVRLNGKIARPGLTVKEGDKIEGEIAPTISTSIVPESIPLSVLHEDDDLLVIDKPSGLVVHPGAGNKTGTLVHALLGRGGPLSSSGGGDRPGIVHRLDKETSGVMLVAKNNSAHKKLQSQFESRTLSKTYLALVKGHVRFEEGRLEGAIGRHPKVRHKMAVSVRDDAREAFSRYRVMERFPGSTLLEVKIRTGRTHQIRVHMEHEGHPVVGDKIYGTEGSRLGLHAWKIEFDHPKTGERMEFESPVPKELQALIEEWRTKKK